MRSTPESRPRRASTRLGAHVAQASDLRCSLPVGSAVLRRGHELRLLVAPAASAPVRDGRLIALILKAHDARRQLFGGAPIGDQAPIYSDKHLARLARLAFLAPDIVAAILDGSQPPQLTARRMLRAPEVPMLWSEQRRMFGFA